MNLRIAIVPVLPRRLACDRSRYLRNSALSVSACIPSAPEVPGVTAGYGDEVIFADGTFVDGSTLELSADGPLRPPYLVYAQGCTHWTHWALIVESALAEMKLVPSG